MSKSTAILIIRYSTADHVRCAANVDALTRAVIVNQTRPNVVPAGGMLGFRITHSLSERDKLSLIELHRSGEPLIVDRPTEYGRQPFRSAKQIDVLTDEASIDRGVKPLFFVGDILHAIAMSDIDEIEGSGCDEILQACRRPDVGFQVRQQRVSLGIIEPHPVRHGGINIDYHDVTPVGSRPVATRPVDPVRSPQQVRENLWWQGTLELARLGPAVRTLTYSGEPRAIAEFDIDSLVRQSQRAALNAIVDSAADESRREIVRRHLRHLDEMVGHSAHDVEDRNVALQEDRQGLGLSRKRP